MDDAIDLRACSRALGSVVCYAKAWISREHVVELAASAGKGRIGRELTRGHSIASPSSIHSSTFTAS